MTKKKSVILGCILLLLLLGVLWWFLPVHFLRWTDPQQIQSIQVWNGNNGNFFTVTDPEQIQTLVEQIRPVPFQKEDISLMGMGTTYNLTFLDAQEHQIAKFIVMSENSIRKDPFFYRCDGELLSPAMHTLEALEQKYFPEN